MFVSRSMIYVLWLCSGPDGVKGSDDLISISGCSCCCRCSAPRTQPPHARHPARQPLEHDRLDLLASAYGGADGFLEGGRFDMHQNLSGASTPSSDAWRSATPTRRRPG